ncbi:MAG TPA: gluconokinase [Puia sp.]|jgi:gluconokinase|nr:gluconokinase [Puia sp.]
MKYVIGIDIGTTSTKAVAFTADGKVLGSAGASYPVFTDVGGRHELDPDQLIDAVQSALAEVLLTAMGVTGSSPSGVSFSCAFHSLLAIDTAGKPLTRAMTWADLRPSAAAKALKGSEAGRQIYEHTGTPIHAMSPLCKLLWLKDDHPDIFDRAARFIGIKEYIWWRLTGKYQVDHSIASATGLFDIRRRDWYPESLALAGIDAGRLSDPVPCTHIETEKGLPYIIGGGDGCLANLGSGAVRPGETALTIGTSGAIRMTVAAPEDDPEGRIFNYILSADRYTSGGATNNGGNVLKWLFEKVFGIGDEEEEWQRRVNEAEGVPAGCEGLIFLPYLQGERAPVWDADARGVFFGVRAIHDHRHFTRACLEGISYSLCQIGASVEETLGPIEHIVASGGFTRSDVWLQMIADVFNKRVYLTGVADASAIGAAIMGFLALGLIDDLDAARGLIQIVRTYEPEPERHSQYRENYRVFTQLYGRLADLM